MHGAHPRTYAPLQLRKFISVLAVIVVFLGVASGQYATPHISFTDLPSGPITGGQSGQGAFITIYGNRFGTTQGTSTVTIGGVAVAHYVQWSDNKIVVQPGSAVVSGSIVVTVGGAPSNPIPFTVRAGRIYFVSNSGNDSQRGSYSKPWKTILKAKNAMAAGDITYVRDGVAQYTDSNYAALTITSSGGAAAPKSIIAYPGAKVTIGSATGHYYGIQSSGFSNWILAGMTIQGAVEALDIASGSNWRLIGNDLSCPAGHGSAACLNVTGSQSAQVLGNSIHDAGNSAATDRATYSSVAFSGANTVDIGWNKIANTGGCRALSFSSTTANQYGVTVHDNLISNVPCDAISLQGMDPSLGKVKVFNNVVYRAANACVSVGGSGLGTAQILSNTFYDCGAAMTPDSGGLAASTPVSVIDNLFYVTSGENYVTPNTNTSWLSGSNNGGTFAGMQNSMTADPQFVNPTGLDFHLQSSSPAIDAGISSGVATDYDSIPRPQGKQYDIGAFEFYGQPTSSVLSQTPSAISFGSVTTGSSSTQSVTVSNTGSVSATITQINVSGAGFSASGPTLPITLAPGQTTSYTVTFAPQVSGTASGSVSLATSSSSSSNSVQLSGTAVQPAPGTLAANPTSLSFGSVTVGSSSSQSVTVTASSASVTISQATATGAGLSISGPTLPVTLAAGQSAAFTVKFAPTSAGSVTGSLSFVSNASNTPTSVPFSGTGVNLVGTLAVTPSVMSFGSVTVGASSTQTATITASSASVTISQANLTGAGFSISGLTLPLTLSAGQSASFTVTFAPMVSGTFSGNISLVSNASNTPTAIALSGTGATAIVHSVALSWTASTSAGVVGYYVYRGTLSGGPYTKITPTSLSTTSYTDLSVAAGSTYYYVVTAVDTNGVESSFSSQVTATVPTP